MTCSRSPSEIGGSLADSDSLRSRESNRPKLSEVHWLGGSSIINLLCKCLMKSLSKVKFGIKRLMEDLDSGQGGEEEFESDLILNLFFSSSVVCYSIDQLLKKMPFKGFSGTFIFARRRLLRQNLKEHRWFYSNYITRVCLCWPCRI